MPIMDKEMVLCESMSIAKNADESTDSTYEIYIPQVKNHKGTAIDDSPNNSGRLYWNCVVEDEDLLAAAPSATITFSLYNHSATGAVAGGSVILSKAITETTTSGHPDGTLLFSIPLPAGQLDQYFEMNVAIATQNLSKGKVTSWIGGPVQQGE